MRIGKQQAPFSAISTSTADRITVRGFDLCRDLIGPLSFTDYAFLLLTGSQPTPVQRYFLDATLVAIAEHGLVPSVQASRMTLAAAPEAWQGAVAAGILGCGSVILGAAEGAGRMLAEALAESRQSGETIDAVAARVVTAHRAQKKPLPGFGHPLHSEGDPRAARLLELADRQGTAGDHVAMLRAVEAVIPSVYGRTLPVNVSSAIPAVLLDVDFPLDAMIAIPILARTAGLLGHLLEESRRPIGFIMSHHAEEAIGYDGAEADATRPEAGEL
jgi:citrate synthase